MKTKKVSIEENDELITAAPAMQGEPVAEVSQETFSCDGTSDIITKNLPIGMKLYTAPQPPFQLPDFATDPDDSDEVASLWNHGFKRGWNSCLGAVAKAMQPAEQSTFTVGTDLSDGKLTVVVMKHESGTARLIHTEVIQVAEQQPEVLAEGYFHPLPDESDYEFHDAEQFPDGSNCPACVPAVIVRKSAVTNQPAPDVAQLVNALELAQGFLRNKGHSEEDPFLLGAINAALAPYRKGEES